MTPSCTCGHAPEEHGHEVRPKYPGSTACNVPSCDCIAYQAREEDEEGE